MLTGEVCPKLSQSAEQMFFENVRDNALLAKRRQKKKLRWPDRVKLEAWEFLEAIILEKQEVIAKLKEWGIKISPHNTLGNWEKWGLIPEAIERTSRKAIYPDSTPGQFFASRLLWKEMRLRREEVRKVREAVINGKMPPIGLQRYFYETWKHWSKGPPEPADPREFDPNDPLYQRIKKLREKQQKNK